MPIKKKREILKIYYFDLYKSFLSQIWELFLYSKKKRKDLEDLKKGVI